MKKYLFSFIILVIGFSANSQTPDTDGNFSKIIPPSPNAASFLTYGNHAVNYYSGTVKTSIPIYTIKTKSFTLPITLDYSGGNGIKVEEFASWVGLGWTLNFGGVVSRTIMSLPDDQYTEGYLYSTLPTYIGTLTYDDHRYIAEGDLDGEPDQFNFSISGNSGTFYIKKDESIFCKQRTDLIIKPDIDATSHKITGFEIIDTEGNKYFFEDKENTKSLVIGGVVENNNYNTTSWYLTKMVNHNRTDSIEFVYDTLRINRIKDMIPVNNLGRNDNYSEKYQKSYVQYSKRIKKIKFAHGEVNFIRSSDTIRYDKRYDVILEKIEIENNADSLITKVEFKQSYFANSSVYPKDTVLTFTDEYGFYNLRLKLDKILFSNSDGEYKPPYIFSYYLDEYLPGRLSRGKDHWGYYNGQTTNTSLEPFYYCRYPVQGSGTINDNFGNADREPRLSYAQAGVLNKILYPTGGTSEFTYELNQVSNVTNQFIPNNTSSQNISLDADSSETAIITIVGIDNPLTEVEADMLCDLDTCAYITITFTDTTNSDEYGITLDGDSYTGSRTIESVILPPSVYLVETNLVDIYGHNPCDGVYGVTISWENELETANKNIGGLRIKQITTNDNFGGDQKKYFKYSDDSNVSSGRLVNELSYGRPAYWADQYGTLFASGWWRTINSNLPLIHTQGNIVGYKRVDVIDSNSVSNGKTSYFFTSSEEYPNVYRGYHVEKWDDSKNLVSGDTVLTLPIPPADDLEFMRGKLIKEIVFKNISGGYEEVKRSEKEYSIDFYEYPGLRQVTPVDDSINYDVISGIKVSASNDDPPTLNIKYYELHDAYHKDSLQADYILGIQNSIYTKTTYSYDHADDETEPKYVLTNKVTEDSRGVTVSEFYNYSFETDSFPEFDTSSYNPVLRDLESRNILTPLKTVTYKNSEFVGKTVTEYADNSDFIAPKTIWQTFEEDSLYVAGTIDSYDSDGNITQFQSRDSLTTSLLWGYNRTLPVAKVVNATVTEVEGCFSSSDLNTIRTGSYSDASLRNLLDTIIDCQALDEAQISYYTYMPLVGMTSQTDENGATTYYEYDEFRRLKYTKDFNGYYRQQNEYQYDVSDHQSTAPTSISMSPGTITRSQSSVLTVQGGTLGEGASYKWYTSSCGGTSAGEGNSITVSPDVATTYYVRAEGYFNATTCTNGTVNIYYPEIDVKQGTTNIVDGVTSFNMGDILVGSYIQKTFTVENIGDDVLAVGNVQESSGHFSISTQPASTVNTSSSTTFTVKFEPASSGVKSTGLSFTNDDTNEDPFNFTVTGEGLAPEINVKQGTTVIQDGLTSFNMGNVVVGDYIEKIFTVENIGEDPLTLGTVSENSTQFSVTSQPSSSVSSGSSTTFIVRFTPTSSGNKSGTVTFSNNDYDENPFNFTVAGDGLVPEIDVKQVTTDILDGLTTFDVGDVAVGSYLEKTFTIENNGEDPLTLGTVSENSNQFSITSQPSSSVSSGSSTTFIVRFTPTSSGNKSGAVTFSNNDYNEDPFNFTVTGDGLVPEINVKQGTTSIPDGTGSFDFGNVAVGENLTKTFTIENTGDANLTLGTVSENSSQFSITAQPSSPVSPGSTTTFNVRFLPTSSGNKSATVTFTNGDDDEDPYSFTVTGVGLVPEINVKQGTTTLPNGSGTYNFGNVTVGENSSQITFTIENTGQANLLISGNVTENSSQFSIQQQPSSPVLPGSSSTFKVMFSPTSSGSKSGTVTINNNDSDEGVYTFTIQGTGQYPEVNVKQGSTNIPDGTGSYSFGDVTVGSSNTIQFTIENLGLGNLSIDSDVTENSNQFSFYGAQPPDQINPSSSATFSIKFSPTSTGSKSATVTFDNSDPNEDPYNFTVNGNGLSDLTADFTYVSDEQNAKIVYFTDTSTGSPTSWAWDFTNNGSTDSTSQNPTHTYPDGGNYSCKLTASKTGASDNIIKTVRIFLFE